MLIVALVMGTQVMNAQDAAPGKRPAGKKRMTAEQMCEMQCNRMVDELGLDDATAAKFTDVYKKYMKEMNEARKLDDGLGKPKAKPEEGQAPQRPTDEQVEKMIKARFAQSRKLLDIREKYYDEFRKFLSPKQIQRIYDQGQMNRGKFRQEMNRRAGMKKPDGKRGAQMPPRPEEGQPQE